MKYFGLVYFNSKIQIYYRCGPLTRHGDPKEGVCVVRETEEDGVSGWSQVYMYIHIYTYIYAIYIYTHIHIYIYIYIYIHIYIYIYMHICVCLSVCLSVCLYVCMYTYIYITKRCIESRGACVTSLTKEEASAQVLRKALSY
jgi:hypothetical protein